MPRILHEHQRWSGKLGYRSTNISVRLCESNSEIEGKAVTAFVELVSRFDNNRRKAIIEALAFYYDNHDNDKTELDDIRGKLSEIINSIQNLGIVSTNPNPHTEDEGIDDILSQLRAFDSKNADSSG